MNEKTFRVLEFNKIKEILKGYTVCAAGKSIIDELKPYDNIYEVREHLEETREAETLILKKGNPPFEGVYDCREDVERAGKGGTLMPSSLLKIGYMLKCGRNFKEYISHKEEEQSYRVLEDICIGINPLKNLEDEIFNAIIGENEISDKASNTLYNIRRSLREKNSSVKDKVNSVMRTYSSYLQDNLYTIRGDRYVIPVKAEHKSSVPGLVHDQSATGATLFIEPMVLVQLNNDIKELMLKEKSEIDRILSVLSRKVYNDIKTIKNNANIIWELDFIFAKAKYGLAIDGTCPNVNEEGFIDIIEGRHPLIERKKVVPMSLYLGKDFSTIVITGPNTGGKTVSLKTTGLLHLMALSGLLIPAKSGSTVSFFEKVLADIGDEQSIEQSLSTFSAHMTNIVKIIDEADEKSLVLFDELGAGTDPTEGAALALTILENLRKRKCRVIATTHYSELKGYALKTQGVENASVEFDVETLRPTYRLLIGIPGKSNAFEISRKLGLPNYIIEEAKLSITSESLKFEDLIQSLQDKSIKAERDAREAEETKLKIKNIKEKYEEKLYNINNLREKEILEAHKKAKEILKDAKEEADSIMKNIREFEKMGYSSEVRGIVEEERKRLKDKLQEAEEKAVKVANDDGESLNKIKIGEEAYIPSLNQTVIILTLPDNKGDVQVQAGIMKINVNKDDLRAPKNSSKEVKRVQKREAKLRLQSVSTSIDLRGKDAEEALYETDKYLDEAFMAGLPSVTIIHGKGSGILRNAINDMMKRHSHVKNYRLGEYGEGGTGVTIVELK